MTRSQIEHPPTSPADRLVQFKTLGGVYWRLGAMLLQAYRAHKTVYFQHKLRFFLEDLEREFPQAKDLPMSDEPKAIAAALWNLLRKS